MTKGIIKITPKPGSPGQVQVTNVEPNQFGVKAGSILEFSEPGFQVKVNDSVDCTIISHASCNLVKGQV